MSTTYEALRWIHVALGTVALVTFWSAGLARKGSPVHRASGKVYLAAMAVLLAVAVPMTWRIGLSGRTVTAAFLAYLLLITATATWKAWRAIRDKRDFARYAGRGFRALAVAMDKRHPLLPDTPTFKELGVDWVDGAYRGIGVPKSTPPEARKRLADLWMALNNDPEMKQLAAKSGFELVNVGNAEMAAFMKEKTALYTDSAKRLGLGK